MRILAVDDDSVSLELLAHFVESHGEHELTSVASAFEAVRCLKDRGPEYFDVFFFDIQMPQMNGIELTTYVRQTLQFRDTPVIMLTSMADKAHIDSAFAAGATDYVTKPYDSNDLRGRLSLVERLFKSETLVPQQTAQPRAFDDPIALADPISIFEVDNVIDHVAMENYALQLSRSEAFGSSTFALAIRDIIAFHESLSPYEFHSLISDVAEVISDAMAGNQFLLSYSGYGVLVCVAEQGWAPDIRRLEDRINLFFARTELFNNSGERLYVRVSVGRSVRFVWKSGQSVLNALAKANDYAEAARMASEDGRNDVWTVGQIA